MSILNGDTGIKIIESFNVFLSNNRNVIREQDADGFIDIEIKTIKDGQYTGTVNNIRTLFIVETTIDKEVFQIIDESKLAELIGRKIQEVLSVSYFGLMKATITRVAMSSGYDSSFIEYEIKANQQ
jgi:hypothetical protein